MYVKKSKSMSVEPLKSDRVCIKSIFSKAQTKNHKQKEL